MSPHPPWRLRKPRSSWIDPIHDRRQSCPCPVHYPQAAHCAGHQRPGHSLTAGKVTARLRTADATETSLAKEMVGREVVFRLEHVEVEMGKPILEVEDLSALNDKGSLALKGVHSPCTKAKSSALPECPGMGSRSWQRSWPECEKSRPVGCCLTALISAVTAV